MRYEDLTTNLKNNILPAYLINGGESFLTVSSLNQIEQALNITVPDFNKIVFADNYSGTAKDIVSNCQVMPLGDKYRMVIVNDFINKKNENEKKVFLDYLKAPNINTCLVFFSTNESDFFNSLKGKVEEIDCHKLSSNYLFLWLKNKAKNLGLILEQNSINKLLDYCNFSITKLDSELNKLYSIKLSSENKTITNKDIEDYITKDLEYVIFDLTNAISRKDNNKAYLLIDAMIKNKEKPVSIISTLSNHFRRLFFIARSNFSTKEMSEYLNIKEYAVVKYREQTSLFSQKQLKEIFDLCVQVEFMAKNGQMEGKNAISYLLANVLK